MIPVRNLKAEDLDSRLNCLTGVFKIPEAVSNVIGLKSPAEQGGELRWPVRGLDIILSINA